MISKIKMYEQKIVWLDCDPGHDDMLAIILAACHESLELLGVSTSAGNSKIENTTKNSLDILHLIGRDDVEVVRGASKPMWGRLETAEETHGESGLEGAELPTANRKPITHEPYLHIYHQIMKASQKVHWVNTGSMTNLAIMTQAFPEIKNKLESITMMAGAIGLGNWSPAAEFNVLLDPIASAIVFSSGIPITLVPLEVTHTALVTQNIFSQFVQLPAKHFGETLVKLYRKFQQNYLETQDFAFPPAHDPCAVFYLIEPAAFHGRKVVQFVNQAFVSIDPYPASYGRTNCEFNLKRNKGLTANAFVCEKLDVCRFWETMIKALAKVKSYKQS